MKVGIIGTGFIGAAHAAAYKNIPGVELAAIADMNQEVGSKVAKEYGCKFYTDAQEMMTRESLNIVDVCLPTFLHKKFVLMAISNGKHVICEKPFALQLDEAEEMVEAAEKAGVTFMIAQVIRFWPEYIRAKELFDSGDIGNIKMIYANRLAQHPDWTTWHRDVEKSGGGLFDLHIHDIDYLCYLLGNVERVYAIGDKDSNDCWNHVMSTLVFKNGGQATVEGAFEMNDNFPFTMGLRIVGDKAAYDYNFSAGFNLEDVDGASRSAVLFKNGSEPEIQKIDEFDAYQKELEYFTGCIRDGVPVDQALPRHSLYVLEVIMAIRESLETGKAIVMG